MAHARSAASTFNGAPSSPPSVLSTIFQTLPWLPLSLQFLWTAAVTTAAYFLSRSLLPESSSNASDLTLDNYSTLTHQFWSLTRLNVPASLSFGVGWALFLLLSFYLRQAVTRHRDARLSVARLSFALRRVVRLIRTEYPSGNWHPGDHQRILAHLIAYPLSLSLSLSPSRALDLDDILHPDDVQDVLSADFMHLHCSRVVRAYLSVSDDDSPQFEELDTQENKVGKGLKAVNSAIVDDVDVQANRILSVTQFRPAVAYINHLAIFLYIWLLFIPLSLISSGGWFTVIWTLLITYAVVMLFRLAHSLNSPFGGVGGIPDTLYDICKSVSDDVYFEATQSEFPLTSNLEDTHSNTEATPSWLLQLPPPSKPSARSFMSSIHYKLLDPARRSVIFSLFAFTLWTTFILVLSYFLRDRPRALTDRWWTIYIPLDSSTVGYISMILSVLFGFWLDDAYTRYRRALELWTTTLMPYLRTFATQAHTLVYTHGAHLHERDIERFISYVVALPFVLKSTLRGTSVQQELIDIFSSKDDVNAVASARSPPLYVLTVINSYVNALDSAFYSESATIDGAVNTIQLFIPRVEDAVVELGTLRAHPVPIQLRAHLIAVTAIWLAILPLNFVSHDAFLSYLYLLPSAYCILYLLRVGFQLDSPFGVDTDDLPLNTLCDEFIRSIYTSYKHVRETPSPLSISSSPYSKDIFKPQPELKPSSVSENEFILYVRKAIEYIPRVHWQSLVIAVLWNTLAVGASYGLSKIWDDQRQDECRKWCSPIDVDGNTLSNLGLTLFVVLSFRAFDAVGRYETAARSLRTVRRLLRETVSDMLLSFADGAFHPQDKERIIVYATQLPLELQHALLKGTAATTQVEEEMNSNEIVKCRTLLCEEDFRSVRRSADPINMILSVIESYVLTYRIGLEGSVPEGDDNPEDDQSRNEGKRTAEAIVAGPATYLVIIRLHELREEIARLCTVKRFPFANGYRQHQQVFIAFWLALLPLSMTESTGFLTILWSSLIAYGLIALEEIAVRLVDPFGNSSTSRLPVVSFCDDIVSDILDVAASSPWHPDEIVHASLPESNVPIEAVLSNDGKVVSTFTPLTLDDNDRKNIDNDDIVVRSARDAKPHGILTHFVYSIPWSAINFVTGWTVIACVLSFISRERKGDNDPDVRWWLPFISIAPSAAVYLSFLSFTTLGFYVGASSTRYSAARRVWTDTLRWICHSLTDEFVRYFPTDSLHSGDTQRVIGHIAALPYALAASLRHSRDVRPARRLLSKEDYAALTQSRNMPIYCLSVVRAYMLKVAIRPETIVSDKVMPGRLNLMIRLDVFAAEAVIEAATFIREVDTPRAFSALLDAWLVIWFTILPFILAETSGWLTIVLMPFIALALLGMRAAAHEIQHPYGDDVNDLDLDSLAHSVASDLVRTYHHARSPDVLNPPSLTTSISAAPFNTIKKPLSPSIARGRIGRAQIRLAISAVSVRLFTGFVAWCAVVIAFAYLISKKLPLDFGEDNCSPWFCTAIAVDPSAKEFIGFGLFVVLGLRMSDSHNRYEEATRVFREDIMGSTYLFASRFFQTFTPSVFRPEHYMRLSSHIAAFTAAVCTQLRNKNNADTIQILNSMVSESDSELLVQSSGHNSADRVVDTIRAYLLDAEAKKRDENVEFSGNELTRLLLYLRALSSTVDPLVNIKRAQLPQGFLRHLQTFLALWILLLPFTLVERTGWLSILWAPVIAYGVIGVGHWAYELSDPFGHDTSDLPLESFANDVFNIVERNKTIFETGVSHFIKRDRLTLLGEKIDKGSSGQKDLGDEIV